LPLSHRSYEHGPDDTLDWEQSWSSLERSSPSVVICLASTRLLWIGTSHFLYLEEDTLLLWHIPLSLLCALLPTSFLGGWPFFLTL
jgi:hypothetical protein